MEADVSEERQTSLGEDAPRAVSGDSGPLPPPRLYLSHSSNLDWLIALEFGRVDDGQPPENWREVNERFGFLHDDPGGRCLGFKALGFSSLDPDHPSLAEIWDGPHFDAPQLGLSNAEAGEIVVAARPLFDGVDSLNRFHFERGCHTEGEEALVHWQCCLEAGDAMAHFALGYTLYELGRHREAYAHLRHYTEIAPQGSWNWCWYGKGAEAVGELDEARSAYRRALVLEEQGEAETEAAELLTRLEERS
jgi:tetratricopeptide (TPR) repeat protein